MNADNFTKEINPWEHYTIIDALPVELLSYISSINDSEFIAADDMKDYAGISYYTVNPDTDLYQFFNTIDTKNILESICNKKLSNRRCHISLSKSVTRSQEFIHEDDSSKSLSLLIYLPTVKQQGTDIGTWLYDQEKKLSKKCCFNYNTGLMFVPSSQHNYIYKTWHSVPVYNLPEPRTILMVNYLFDQSYIRLR